MVANHASVSCKYSGEVTFEAKVDKLSRERDELSTERDDLSRQKKKLRTERDELSREREYFEALQGNFDKLSRERDVFSREKDKFSREKENLCREKEQTSREKEKWSKLLMIAQESSDTMMTINGVCKLLEQVDVSTFTVSSTECSDTLAEAARRVHAFVSFEMQLMEAERTARVTERKAAEAAEQCPGTRAPTLNFNIKLYHTTKVR